MKVRVRGIYATALTGLFLDAGHDVVDASPPIRERFDAALADGVPDVAIRTTDDRQGVGLAGPADPDAGGSGGSDAGGGDPADAGPVADAADRLAGLARDVFRWPDPAPRGAVFDGRVTETLGGGAVVDLGPCEGYLPYDATADRVETGDVYRLQVREAAAPWASARPELGTELRAPGEVVTLEPGSGTRVDARDAAAGRELAGMTELLGIEPPTGWGVRWHRPALDAGMDALGDALSDAVARAEAIEAAVDAAADPSERAPAAVVRPTAGAWVWFGREARTALDERRRATTTTMPGHHRIKAGSNAASAGVDFAEALCDPAGDFPFGVVVDQFGPREGEAVRLEHGKPDGRLIVLGDGEVSDLDPAAGSLTVTREMTPGGTYDELGVEREAGDTATTKVKEGRWWYPTTYRDAGGTVKGTYVNVCTPVEVFPDAVRYVDLHVDVVKHADGTVERVDDDRLDEAVAAGHVTEELAEKARDVASALERAL